MSTQHQFLQRTIATIEQDAQQLTAMYLHAVSTKNILLAEQCEAAIQSAYQSISAFTNTLKAAQRPVRKRV